MSTTITLTPDEATELARDALVANRTSISNADTTARALVRAEIDGQTGHGLSRIATYAAQSLVGKVDGFARPEIRRVAAAGVRVDARRGFAFPAIDSAIAALVQLAPEMGVAVACIHNSHHFGQAGAHVEQLAEQGLVGMFFGNTPRAIAFWGSDQPMMGTNPIAFAAPVAGHPPVVIDLSMSVVARGRIFAAGKANRQIPDHWALDADGQPTTDPEAALRGSMVPIGGAKGSALALMVEILAAALTASSFGFEASSVLDAEGESPRLGQTILALDPSGLSGGQFARRMTVLVDAINAAAGSRLPGTSRLKRRQHCLESGLSISAALFQEILDTTETGNNASGTTQ